MTSTEPTRKMISLDDKLARMQQILRELKSVAVAFSAGVDSTLVLKVAFDTLGPENVVAVTGQSDSIARSELEQTKIIADLIGVEHVIIETDEFENPEYLKNPTNRCYFCKTTLYSHLEKFITQRGINAMVNGINADDLNDFRPGIAAASEHNVRCPIADAGLTKQDVRDLSRRFNLPTYDKPASPCLSSRVPYGQSITPEKLRMIESAEACLHLMGFRECRVRHHENIARIEVNPEDIPRLVEPESASKINQYFRSLGYQYVTLDLKGFRSGSLNEVIAFGTVQPVHL